MVKFEISREDAHIVEQYRGNVHNQNNFLFLWDVSRAKVDEATGRRPSILFKYRNQRATTCQ